ncbi:outer membrane protein HopL [Helicobacter pylori Puno120]|uniref:Hop family outer membrane protein HopL n=1 Tax=Helicobacter pylori TaxID=210 RepID=UPI0002291068|nr:Hop family outer membrane protein HopL [Helicobacter pylori]AEN15719.1 outer membrane protein HopL [Helicobacter pylori Puno120]
MIKKAKKFIPFFLIGSLLAEDNGWYMSVGYQIGGTQQFINNKQLLENESSINSITQSAINIAGPTTGLITLSSQSVIDALGYGVSNTVGNQLEGISNILNQIGKRKDFFSSRQISSISQQIIGLKGSSDPLKAHSSQITAKLLSNTQSAFDQGIALSSNIISSINGLNPSNNTKEVKAQLQNTTQSMAELLQQIEHSITKTTSTTYAQSLLSNLTDAVNASSNNTAYVSALKNALTTLGVGYFPTTTTTHVVLNPPGQIVFYPTNSILGSTSSNSNNQQQYNNTLLMNTLQGGLSANTQNNPNGCTNQIQCLEQFIQNLAPLAATPTSNNQANQQVQAIAQKLQSVAINTLDNNAINNTTYNLNNLHNALNFQAYESTIEQYNNALKQISWISFSEPKNLLKNTSNNYQIGTVTNAQGQNISAYDCASATGSLSSDTSSGISCSATSSTNNTSSFDNSLVATSKIQTINGKEQIGVNSFNLVSQVWSVYNSLKTSEENLKKNANILCANGSPSGTSSCNTSSSGGLSISGNAQLQNILSSTSGTTTTTQAKSNAPKLKAMVVVNNEEEAKTTNLAQSGGATTQSPNSTVMGALNTVLQNVSNFQQSIQSAFQSQSSNIQAWANEIYNTNGSRSQEMTPNNNQNLRIQLRANFYQLINTINQQVPTDMNALINQSQQTQQTSGATNNNACAGGTNGSGGNWCYQQWSDSKAYYSGLQSALGYQTQATTQNGSSGGNTITYNVQQITLTSGGLLNQIITNLKGVNGGSNGGSSGNGNGTSQINTAYQMLTDASDGKLGTYNSSGNSGSNNGYQTCTNGSNGASGSNCYTPNKQNATSATTANTATATDSNLQKVYNDAQKIADIIASSGNNKGVENGLKQFFEALKNNSNSLSNLCNDSSNCTGGLINLLGAIPTNGVSDTNNLINLLTEFIKTAGFIQNNDNNSSNASLTSAFQAITSAISQGFQALQNDISPNAILTLLQEITSNTTTIQSFSQTLRQLLGDKTFFMVQQKLIDAMINARNQVQNAQNQANNYGSQPILSQYVAAKSTQHGMSNGLGIGLGYKYFFGKARKLGLRHYFFFDYGFSEIGLANQSVKANIFAYGVGTDFLWNLFRRTYNTKALNFGLFAGVQLGGATWLSSLRQQIIDNWGNANDIHSTNFQVALNFGVRTNFAEFKRFAKKFHNQGVISQKSVEFGIKVPLINQAYLRSAGADVSYRRLYTFYINYIMGF